MDARHVTLPASLDTAAAEPLKAALLGARGAPLTLDASEVERLGGLCLQLLLSARRTWAEDGRVFAIAGASTRFTEQLAALSAPDLTFRPEGDR